MMNIRVQGDVSRICFSELRSLTRCATAHSSHASMHINVRSEDVMAWSIFTISGSRGPRPPMTILCSSKARVISSGTLSIPPTTCLTKEPRILATDCSFRAAKSRQKHVTAVFCPLVWSPNLSTTSELTLRPLALTPFLLFFVNNSGYLINVLPTPGPPQQNKTPLSPSVSPLLLFQLLNSSVCKSHSPTLSTRRSWMSRWRSLGSRGDSQVSSGDRSSAIVQLFHTLLKEFVVLKELLLSRVECWDIFRSLLLAPLQMRSY